MSEHFRIFEGHVLDRLREMPSESVDCVITSPPYWGLRNYGCEGQIGLEPSPAEFVAKMVEVFAEVRRVLKKSGTCWVNLGDTYASCPSKGGSGPGGKNTTAMGYGRPGVAVLMAWSMTESNEIEMERRGAWTQRERPLHDPGPCRNSPPRRRRWLRDEIIWHKPNPMPSSVTDRTTPAHEMVYLLTKSKKYYYDAYSIRTAYAEKTFTTFGCRTTGGGDQSGLVQSENWARDVPIRKPRSEDARQLGYRRGISWSISPGRAREREAIGEERTHGRPARFRKSTYGWVKRSL